MKIAIKNKFWIVELSDSSRDIFDNEKEAVQLLKNNLKNKKQSRLQIFTFKSDGNAELKEMGWETIAKQLIESE